MEMTPFERDLSDAYLASIIASSDDAIISKNLRSIVTSWNPAAERIFGYTAEEMIGQPIHRLIPSSRLGEEDEIISRITRGDRIDHFQTIRRCKDGREVHVSVTISPIRNQHGEIIGASKIARDITETIALEEKRDQLLIRERELRAEAERANQIKNEFLATLSHELRTPLTAILGWAQILRKGPVSEEILAQASDVIYRNTKAQTQLVEDLLDMNRILMGKVRLDLTSVDLPGAIASAIETVQPSADAKGIRISTEIDLLTGTIRGDQIRLQQVIWNLLTNAVKFTPSGGRVEIGLSQHDATHICLKVSDSGIGIPPEFLSCVFDRFSQADASTTRRYGGLGLGLSIVKHLVELHGGTISVHSLGTDQGTSFTILLPVPPPPRRENPTPNRLHLPALTETPDQPTIDLVGKRILLVEDDRDTSEMIRHTLSGHGAEVTVVESAKQALAQAPLSRFHVLISDIGMPDMDGFDLIKAVRGLDREIGGGIPAVALTAFSRSEDRRRALLLGFDVFLSKPVDPTELIAIILRCTDRS